MLFDVGERRLAVAMLHGRGRHSGVEAAIPVAHVFRWREGPLGSQKVFVRRGGDPVTAWEKFRIEADQYREIDAERTLVVHDYTGRGKTSGLELGQIRSKGATLFHVRGGKVTRLVQYWDADRALADLGLRE